MTLLKQIPVITIDGPSGTGKGTVSGLLAEALGWHYLDSGALYRLLALQALRLHIVPEDVEALVELARHLDIEFVVLDRNKRAILLADDDVTEAIRTESVGNMSSKISAYAPIRAALEELQHSFRKLPGLVTDGRDMGTVIFPDATLKIFMTASPEIRAKRRYQQLIKQGINVTLAVVQQEMDARDKRDSSRAVAPLKPADDAIVIDTSELSIDAVLANILTKARERLG